jgi:hypothetical protein
MHDMLAFTPAACSGPSGTSKEQYRSDPLKLATGRPLLELSIRETVTLQIVRASKLIMIICASQPSRFEDVEWMWTRWQR